MQDLKSLALEFLGVEAHELTEREKRVLERLVTRRRIARNINRLIEEDASFGERLADQVAKFGGSWLFIILFATILALWISGNLILATFGKDAFDPYPFIFLNLVLSMLAAIQAPIIMMSQNRQSTKDRVAANHDYEVNLKAEIEIMQLHEKLDAVRQQQTEEVIVAQAKQLALLEKLVAELAQRLPPDGPEARERK